MPGGSNRGVDPVFEGPNGANEAGYRKDLLNEVRVSEKLNKPNVLLLLLYKNVFLQEKLKNTFGFKTTKCEFELFTNQPCSLPEALVGFGGNSC